MRLQRGGSAACPAAFATSTSTSKSTSTSGLQSSQRCPRMARPTQSSKGLREGSFHCRPRANRASRWRASCPHPFGQLPSRESCGSRCWLHSSVHGMAISRCKCRAASCQSMDARQAAFNVPQSQRGNIRQHQEPGAVSPHCIRLCTVPECAYQFQKVSPAPAKFSSIEHAIK